MGGAPDLILEQRPQTWAIWTADAATGEGRQVWKSPNSLRGSPPSTHGGVNLHWAAAGRIVFLSYMDGWPHLYSIPERGGAPQLLTPGDYMAEHVSISPDRRYLVFAGNMGRDADDIDRRHVVRVPVDRAAPEVLTPGHGLEWSPRRDGRRPPRRPHQRDGRASAAPGRRPFGRRPPSPARQDRLSADFPAAHLVTPRKVVYKSPDGVQVHAQLFERPGGAPKKPAIVYVHGGPPRQMLLGWHYSDYYSNAYALNQYLASRGYVVLSVNYRLGIGYGHDFHRPAGAARRARPSIRREGGGRVPALAPAG